MNSDKTEIDKLIDKYVSIVIETISIALPVCIKAVPAKTNLKTVLPNSLSESMVMFHESNVENLKKIKEFLNG